MATLNLQVGVSPGQTIPDAWHHQMVFGVGHLGVYLTNPLECVSDSLLADQLCSDSVLLVRRADVVNRWDRQDKLISLSLQSDPRWNEMNVLGKLRCYFLKEGYVLSFSYCRSSGVRAQGIGFTGNGPG